MGPLKTSEWPPSRAIGASKLAAGPAVEPQDRWAVRVAVFQRILGCRCCPEMSRQARCVAQVDCQ
eukprot:2157672-Alexandrium_andersonii.AAC.1